MCSIFNGCDLNGLPISFHLSDSSSFRGRIDNNLVSFYRLLRFLPPFRYRNLKLLLPYELSLHRFWYHQKRHQFSFYLHPNWHLQHLQHYWLLFQWYFYIYYNYLFLREKPCNLLIYKAFFIDSMIDNTI